jgi:hypothetical protein
MFTEYDVAGVISKTGLRPNGTGCALARFDGKKTVHSRQPSRPGVRENLDETVRSNSCH